MKGWDQVRRGPVYLWRYASDQEMEIYQYCPRGILHCLFLVLRLRVDEFAISWSRFFFVVQLQFVDSILDELQIDLHLLFQCVQSMIELVDYFELPRRVRPANLPLILPAS